MRERRPSAPWLTLWPARRQRSAGSARPPGVAIETERTVRTNTGAELAACYLSDLTAAPIWDRHTRRCDRLDHGYLPDGGTYRRVLRLGPFRLPARCQVQLGDAGNRIVVSSYGHFYASTETFLVAAGQAAPQNRPTELTYTARYLFPYPARSVRPWLQRTLDTVADQRAHGTRRALDNLALDPGAGLTPRPW